MPDEASRVFPRQVQATIATGAEFLVDLAGPGASFVTVVAPYEPYAAIDGGPIASPPSDPWRPRGFRSPDVRGQPRADRPRRQRATRRSRSIAAVLRYGSLDPRAAGIRHADGRRRRRGAAGRSSCASRGDC